MMELEEIYCLDTNVFIQAWQSYYSKKLCPEYWAILNELGKKGKIFIADEVFKEIEKVDDDLYEWLKTSEIPIRKIDEKVSLCLKKLYADNVNHKFLVDDTKKDL